MAACRPLHRSRPYSPAWTAQERAKVLEEVVQEMQAKGMDAPGGHAGEWDSNVITPGTEFMSRLSTYLWFYILDRMNKSTLGTSCPLKRSNFKLD